jgi:hypothetical protein
MMEDQTTILSLSTGGTPSQESEVALDTSTSKGDSQAKSTSWVDTLPDQLKKSKSLSRYSSIEDLAKGHIELEKTLGDKISVPGKDSKPEEWDRFYAKVGRPEQADNYALEAEGFEVEKSFIAEVKAEFHKAGLSQSQAAAVFDYLSRKAQADQEKEAKQNSANQQLLASAWGAKAGEKVEMAKRFVLKVGGESALAHLEKTGAGSDAVILQLLAAASESTSPHRFVDGEAVRSKPAPYAYMNER